MVEAEVEVQVEEVVVLGQRVAALPDQPARPAGQVARRALAGRL